MYRVLSLACQRGRASRTNYHGNHRTVAAGYQEVRPMPRDCGVQRKGTSRWTLSSARISRLGSPFRARIRLASRAINSRFAIRFYNEERFDRRRKIRRTIADNSLSTVSRSSLSIMNECILIRLQSSIS